MNLILVGLHTYVLSTASYSENTSFYVYAAFANVFLTYGMETAFFRFYNKKKNNKKVFTTLLISLSSTSLLFFTLIMFFKEPVAQWLDINPDRLQILLGILLFDTLAVAAFVLYRIQRKAIKFAIIKIINIAIYVALNFFFLWAVPKYNIDLPNWLQQPKVLYIFIANLFASIIVFLLILPSYLKHKIEFDKILFKQMLWYGLPIMVSGIAFVINENLDKLMLLNFLGKDIMGAYSGCYKLTVFLTLFIQAFRMGVEPFVFNQAKADNAKESYAIVLKFFVIFASLGILFVTAFLDIFKEILIRNENYWIAIKIVPIVLLANWCLGVYHSLSVWYKLTDRTYYGMYISILGAIITVVFNYLFIPKYGFIAAAYTTLIAYGTMMIISYFIGQKFYKIPYDVSRLISYLISALILSFVCLYLFPQLFIVKIASILVYLGIIVIFERNSIKTILNKQ